MLDALTASAASPKTAARDGRNLMEVGAMPKEITYGDGPEFSISPDGSELPPAKQPGEPPTPPILKRASVVSWHRDSGYVELGIQCLEIATSASGTHAGQYASFDRDGINRMIRSLRKARDQAFGADA